MEPLSKMDVSELNKQPPDVTECPFKLDSSIIKVDQKQQVLNLIVCIISKYINNNQNLYVHPFVMCGS